MEKLRHKECVRPASQKAEASSKTQEPDDAARTERSAVPLAIRRLEQQLEALVRRRVFRVGRCREILWEVERRQMERKLEKLEKRVEEAHRATERRGALPEPCSTFASAAGGLHECSIREMGRAAGSRAGAY